MLKFNGTSVFGGIAIGSLCIFQKKEKDAKPQALSRGSASFILIYRFIFICYI